LVSGEASIGLEQGQGRIEPSREVRLFMVRLFMVRSFMVRSFMVWSFMVWLIKLRSTAREAPRRRR